MKWGRTRSYYCGADSHWQGSQRTGQLLLFYNAGVQGAVKIKSESQCDRNGNSKSMTEETVVNSLTAFHDQGEGFLQADHVFQKAGVGVDGEEERV